MKLDSKKPRWAPKVPQSKIRCLYEADAQGIIDSELIDDVGWALWERCDSILTVTAAHEGHVRCPCCENITEHQAPWSPDERIVCPTCDWQMPWQTYHQTYRGKQLFGANAVDIFSAYHQAFPQVQAANTKMLLIDQLIHAFHLTLSDVGRPVAANLIQGSFREVIQFLDTLTSGEVSATGLRDSRTTWRHTLAAASWSAPFIKQETNPNESQEG